MYVLNRRVNKASPSGYSFPLVDFNSHLRVINSGKNIYLA